MSSGRLISLGRNFTEPKSLDINQPFFKIRLNKDSNDKKPLKKVSVVLITPTKRLKGSLEFIFGRIVTVKFENGIMKKFAVKEIQKNSKNGLTTKLKPTMHSINSAFKERQGNVVELLLKSRKYRNKLILDKPGERQKGKNSREKKSFKQIPVVLATSGEEMKGTVENISRQTISVKFQNGETKKLRVKEIQKTSNEGIVTKFEPTRHRMNAAFSKPEVRLLLKSNRLQGKESTSEEPKIHPKNFGHACVEYLCVWYRNYANNIRDMWSKARADATDMIEKWRSNGRED